MRGNRTPKRGLPSLVLFVLICLSLTGCRISAFWGGSVYAAVDTGKPVPAGSTAESPPVSPQPVGTKPSAQPDSNPLPSPSPLPEPTPKPQPESKPKPEPKQDTKPDTKPAADKGKWIALTFDDGPDGRYTPRVLDILKKHGIKATFFLVGIQVEQFPKIARRIAEEGHEIGNHSWSHRDLTGLKPGAVEDQIERSQEVIEEAAGVTPELFRAPFGKFSKPVLNMLRERKMKHVYWTIDPRDWAATPVDDMRKNIVQHAKPDGIVLLHSFGGKKQAIDRTLELLPLIIEDLTEKGYEFATVGELIEGRQVKEAIIQ